MYGYKRLHQRIRRRRAMERFRRMEGQLLQTQQAIIDSIKREVDRKFLCEAHDEPKSLN